MAFPESTVDSVVAALVSGLDGFACHDGKPLHCTDRLTTDQAMADPRLPLLAVQGVNFRSIEDHETRDRRSLTIPALFKCMASKAADGPAAYRRYVDDLYMAVDLIRGLPVDESGRVHPLSEATPRLFYAGKLRILADRGGPHLTSGNVASIPGAPYAAGTVSIAVDFYAPHDRRELHKVRVAVAGLRAALPGGALGPLDIGTPVDGVGFGQPDATWPTRKNVQGADPATVVASVNVSPYTRSIAALATTQLSAVAMFVAGNSQNVSALATWATSDALVATVNASGLVTGVGAGSCSITATWSGVASNPCTVTVS